MNAIARESGVGQVIGAAAGAEEVDLAATRKEKTVRDDEIGYRPACCMETCGAEEKKVIEAVRAGVVWSEWNGERILHRITRVENSDRLSVEELLKASRIEHLDELQTAVAIAVNLRDRPQVKGGVGTRSDAQRDDQGQSADDVTVGDGWDTGGEGFCRHRCTSIRSLASSLPQMLIRKPLPVPLD